MELMTTGVWHLSRKRCRATMNSIQLFYTDRTRVQFKTTPSGELHYHWLILEPVYRRNNFWYPIRNRGPYGYCCNFRGMHGCRVRNTLSWPMMGAAVWSQSDLYVPSIPLTADLQTCKRDASTRNISYITWQAFNLIVRLGIVSSYWW